MVRYRVNFRTPYCKTCCWSDALEFYKKQIRVAGEIEIVAEHTDPYFGLFVDIVTTPEVATKLDSKEYGLTINWINTVEEGEDFPVLPVGMII